VLVAVVVDQEEILLILEPEVQVVLEGVEPVVQVLTALLELQIQEAAVAAVGIHQR
jgi:hypothetical protein